jgi:hypothetical protein
MLRVASVEAIQHVLVRVPGLIEALDRRESGFVSSVRAWLADAEQALISSGSSAGAEVAVLRGVLISAERARAPVGVTSEVRTTARKRREAAAVEVLRKAEEVVSNAIRMELALLAEGERLARQIVSVARRKGLIPAVASADQHAEALKALWHALEEDPDVGSATVHLAGLVGTHDALIVLDRTLPLFA